MDLRYNFHGKYFHLQHSIDEKPNSASSVMHNHSQYELYYFIRGKASFYIEGTEYELHSGDILVMNNNESHCINVSSEHPYERIAMHFDKELIQLVDNSGKFLAPFEKRLLGQQNHYTKHNFEDNQYTHYFNNMIKTSSNQEIQIISYLFPILNELLTAFESPGFNEKSVDSTLINQITLYITDNLSEELSLDSISEHFYICKSLLCTSFKNTIGTSIWNYITIKRLTKAHELINSGHFPTKVFSECGFNDYSTFFRAYKKHFGASPSKHT